MIVLMGRIAYFSRTGIMWARLPVYSLGILCAYNNNLDKANINAIVKGKVWYLKLFLSVAFLLLFALFPVMTVIREATGANIARIAYLPLVFPILFLFNLLISVLPGWIKTILHICGNVSFEIYLIHLFLLYVISHYGLNVFLYPLALLCSIPLAYIANRISTIKRSKETSSL